MYSIEFHPDVQLDIEDAFNWYEGQAQGLGESFIQELEVSYLCITEFPLSWPKFGANFNRYILPRFPFSVVYSFKSNRIFVLAIMHHSRKPGYWKNRA